MAPTSVIDSRMMRGRSPAEADVPVDPDLDDQGVDGGERRGLVDAKQAAVHAAEQRNRKQRLPLGLPERREGFRSIEAECAASCA